MLFEGTFSRGPRGLPPEWYPMEYTDAEIIRRSGYFSDTIGGLPLAQKEIDMGGRGKLSYFDTDTRYHADSVSL
jgi:hypothetical protein